jgi:hypothetical protein
MLSESIRWKQDVTKYRLMARLEQYQVIPSNGTQFLQTLPDRRRIEKGLMVVFSNEKASRHRQKYMGFGG